MITDKLTEWFDRHGPNYHETAEDWINSMTNFELLTWIDSMNEGSPE